MPVDSRVTFETTSAGGYIVRYDGYEIGHVGRTGRKWQAATADFDLGEHRSRREAVEALMDIHTT